MLAHRSVHTCPRGIACTLCCRMHSQSLRGMGCSSARRRPQRLHFPRPSIAPPDMAGRLHLAR